MKNELTEAQEHNDYGRSLVDLPPEVLVKIWSYLPTSDKIKAQYFVESLEILVKRHYCGEIFVGLIMNHFRRVASVSVTS